MAIIIEEEKPTSHAAVLLGVVVMLILLVIAAYYIFFAPPPTVVVAPPPNFANLGPITQINFNPTSVINSSNFQALKQYIAEPTSTGPVSVGRTDPFIAP